MKPGSLQVFMVQTLLRQSSCRPQLRSARHLPQKPPPQSTSVSLPLGTPSAQPGTAQVPAAHSFDGQSDPLGVVLSLKLYEVQTYLSLTAHWWSGFTLLTNAAAWNALPRAMQEVVERNAEKFALLQRADIEQVNAVGAEELARLGMQVNTADTASLRAKLGEFYARWREKAGPAAWRLLESYASEIGG